MTFEGVGYVKGNSATISWSPADEPKEGVVATIVQPVLAIGKGKSKTGATITLNGNLDTDKYNETGNVQDSVLLGTPKPGIGAGSSQSIVYQENQNVIDLWDGEIGGFDDLKQSQQNNRNPDNMGIVRDHPDDKQKESAFLNNFPITSPSNSPDYPAPGQTIRCGAFENNCSSESLPNSNEAARKDYESIGYPKVTYEELEQHKEEAGSYYPGMLPQDRIDKGKVKELADRLEGSQDDY